MNCHCGKPAEVKWTTPDIGGKPSEVHFLCAPHMSETWSEINLKFHGTKIHECSTFEKLAA